MLPIIALLGRPNVGKSTLFNALTKSRNAIVANFPGLTRDRQYGEGLISERAFIVIDTGGIGVHDTAIDELVRQQAELAIAEADILLLLVDGRDGPTPSSDTSKSTRRTGSPPISSATYSRSC